MTPSEVTGRLNRIVAHKLKLAVMLWGAPGIGKSSVVQQVAQAHDLELIDLRLSQLAPTDLRGLPVPENGLAKWFPPEFLPREGKGILFLDELNLAPPAIQGIAQQLVLDRKVGSYAVPPNWFIWAAGNRREDAAAVAEMPAPLANRFAHLEVSADLASLTAYALGAGWHSDIIGFLNFMPSMLHALDKKAHAWPSPRSWDMAGQLMSAGVSVSHAVGDTAGHAFEAYQAVCAHLPDTDAIRAGRSDEPYPAKRELQFAVTTKLAFSITDAQQFGHSVTWVKNPELQQYLVAARLSSFKPDERNRFLGGLRSVAGQFPELQAHMNSARELLEELR